MQIERIGGILVKVLDSNTVDRGFEHGSVRQKTIKLVFVVSPVNTQYQGVREQILVDTELE